MKSGQRVSIYEDDALMTAGAISGNLTFFLHAIVNKDVVVTDETRAKALLFSRCLKIEDVPPRDSAPSAVKAQG